MSKFYATIEGNRMPKTCGGSRNSGIRASAQSYDGSVITTLDYDANEQLIVNVGTNDYSSCYRDGSPSFNGTFEEFKALLKLSEDIKKGNVRIIRHRQNKRL